MELIQLLVSALVGTGTGAGGSYLSFIRTQGELTTKVKTLEDTVKVLTESATRWPREALVDRIARLEETVGHEGEIRLALRELRKDLHLLAADFRSEIRDVADRHSESLSRDEFAEYATATGQRLDRLLEKLGEVRGKLEATHR